MPNYNSISVQLQLAAILKQSVRPDIGGKSTVSSALFIASELFDGSTLRHRPEGLGNALVGNSARSFGGQQT